MTLLEVAEAGGAVTLPAARRDVPPPALADDVEEEEEETHSEPRSESRSESHSQPRRQQIFSTLVAPVNIDLFRERLVRWITQCQVPFAAVE